jgi:transcription initiation factor TFIIB
MDMSCKKTKKNKNHETKKHMWNMFESEIEPDKKSQIECIYRKSGEREFCDICSTNLVYNESGFLCCLNSSCAIVYTDMIDQGAEWRFYGAEDTNGGNPTRCGMPINPLLKESSYSCKVMAGNTSSYEMRKIRRYTEWQSMPYKEKSQYDEFQRINMMAQQSGVSKLIIDNAIIYHKKISEHQTFRGINRDGIIAASIYISFRINNTPRTASEIARIFNLDKTSATKGCKNACSIINTIEAEDTEKTVLCKTGPQSFIERYCSRLNINNELTRLCMFVAKKIQDTNSIPENTPNSIASGIVYFVCQVCDLNISKGDVHKISEISEVTINKCYKKLCLIQETLIPKSILLKYNK